MTVVRFEHQQQIDWGAHRTANLMYGLAETLAELSDAHDFAAGDLVEASIRNANGVIALGMQRDRVMEKR